ncbi:P-loop containing nucleoside triphosphate hydrolase protein, partial [Ramicandelaber brevisporus]
MMLPLKMLPFTMNMVMMSKVSYQRIADYLLKSEEIEPQPDIERDADFAIKITDGSFTWEQKTAENDADAITEKADEEAASSDCESADEKPSADDVTGPAENVFKLPQFSLTVKRGSLVAVVGSVGSGKSSLLAAMIGEMRRTGGTLQLGGTLSYAQQTPWIQNATVRDNILFGRAYDEARYNHVVKVCELERDFQVLPAGDATEIGEKGVNLSGGQKHRVSL